MMDFAFWIMVGFLSGSIPWSILVGNFLAGLDVRSIGDGNPGSANVWKGSGSTFGVLALVLDISKGFVPVYLGFRYLSAQEPFWGQLALSLIAFAPILGHAFSPFLKFRGGKALATTAGSWTAITAGLVVPLACLLLGVFHGVQKNHALTVTVCIVGFLLVFLPLKQEAYIGIFWLLNISLVIYKHRSEYAKGFLPRDWISSGRFVPWQ